MIKYYPSSRIKTDLYTRGSIYKLPNGQPYTGKYYLTYDGQAYSGANPVVGTNEQLTRADVVSNNINLVVGNTSATYTIAKSQNTITQNSLNKTLSNAQLQELQPHYPVPLSSDYQLGYFKRYFAKNVTGPGYLLEISQTDYANVLDGAYETTSLVYEVAEILWQLTGPLNDTRISQYQIQGGVYDTNKRVTETKAVGFRGLVEFIGGDYIKFAKITP